MANVKYTNQIKIDSAYTISNTAVVAVGDSGTVALGKLQGQISSGNMPGGILGDIPYQSSTGVTTYLIPNATITPMYLKSLGNGTTGTAPTYAQVAFTDLSGISSVTLQGNTFNGNSQLIQTTAVGKYPALDGSLITNVTVSISNATNIIGGSATNVVYQTGASTTGFVASNSTTTTKFLSQTGTGSAPNAPIFAQTTIAGCSDVTYSGTWTPLDGSGAGLIFPFETTNYSIYTKIGKLVTVYLFLTYPSTSNGSIAQISGLPYPVANGQLLSCVLSGNATASTYKTQITASGYIGFITISLGTVTNATMSGVRVGIQLTYETT